MSNITQVYGFATWDEETQTFRDAMIMLTDVLYSDTTNGLNTKREKQEGILLAFIVENTKRTYLPHSSFYVLIAKQTAAVRKQNWVDGQFYWQQ